MFGLEILDIVIGLTFIYLLLALMATAVNEYIASLLNKRGKELAKGISRLLEDVEGKDALNRAWAGVSATARMQAASLTEQFYSHRLIRPLATRRGLLARLVGIKEPRLPSYIPARTFSLAFLDILGYHDADAAKPENPGDPTPKPVTQREELAEVLELLKRESPLDVSEHLPALKKIIADTGVEAAVQAQLAGTMVAAQTRLQKLHDSTEVWFNNSMDRVAGSFKRHVQAMLFIIGVGIAVLLNADTVQLWKRLATDDALRAAVAQQAARYAAAMDTAAAPAPAPPTVGPAPAASDTVDPQEAAAKKYRAAKATLDSMQLQLGWTWEEAARLGFAARDNTGKAIPGLKLVDPQGWKLLAKVLGLLMTALAISLGAPFWFDTLNRVIKIRAAGRSPVERLKSPGGSAKRAAELPTK